MSLTVAEKLAVVVACAVAESALAADSPRPQGANMRPDRALARSLKAFDTDRNHRIEGGELEALNRAYAAAPDGALAALDRNDDQKIDEAELAAFRPRGGVLPVLKKVDKDGNQKIEGLEIAALRGAFDAAPAGPLKVFDRNRNSELEDDEIAKVNERLAGRPARATRPAAKRPPEPVAPPQPEEEPGVGTASISWQPPTQNDDGSALKDLAGYVIRYGRSPSSLDKRVTVKDPRTTTQVVKELGKGTWYFTVSSLKKDGLEGRPSPPVSKKISPEEAAGR